MRALQFVKRRLGSPTAASSPSATDPTVEILADPRDHIHELLVLRLRWAEEQDRLLHLDDPFVDEFAEWLERETPRRRFWIARVGGIPVGMVNLMVFERMPTVGQAAGSWGYLCNMFVDEDHRNAGLGAVLAKVTLDYADRQGLERVVLNPSEQSRTLYESLGFEPASNLLVHHQQATA